MGKGSKAPTGYQPTWQGGADANTQGLIQNATPWATALPGQTIPGMQTAAQGIADNPYFSQAMGGAQQGAQYGSATAAGMMDSSNQLGSQAYWSAAGAGDAMNAFRGLATDAQRSGDLAANLGSKAQQESHAAIGYGQNVYDQTQSLIPSTTGGAALAPGLQQQAQGLANLTAGQALGAIPGLTGGMDAAGRVLDTGFDPQNALYDRGMQRTLDTQNALNAMYGLGSSAYGAGLSGDAARNYGLDWGDRQLQRQVSALGAYGQQQGVVTNSLTSLLGSAANNYGNLSNLGTNQYNGLTSTAANNMATLGTAGNNAVNQGYGTWLNGVGQAMNGRQIQQSGIANAGNLQAQGVNAWNSLNSTAAQLYSQAGQQGLDAAQLATASAAAPSEIYRQQQAAALAGFQGLATGASQALNPTAQVTGLDNSYMQTGQGATQLAQNATSINNAQANAQAAGIGKLVGTVAAVAMAPATGGLSLFALGGSAGAAGVKAYG